MIERQRYLDDLAMSAFASELSKKYRTLPVRTDVRNHIEHARLYELLHIGIEHSIFSQIAENCE